MNSLDAPAELDIFDRWLVTIEARFSIQIDANRQAAFKSALNRFVESIGMDLESLDERRKSGRVDAETWSMLLHLATNHETRFFRSLPATERIVKLCEGITSPRILSVGCSSGEEPFSIASALLDAGHPTFRVHGTDVSAVCISTAREGLYPRHHGVGLLAAAPTRGDKMRFHRFVREMVTFEEHNILQDRPVQLANPNIVITQNMLIYYRTDTRYEILDRLSAMLVPGGHLITGPGETLNWSNPSMTRIPNSNPNVFQRSVDV
jgi:chemotaxis methyl-accepting protein methylase